MTTRRKRPQTGAVLARLCSRSTPEHDAQPWEKLMFARTHSSRLRARTGTVTAGISCPQGASISEAASRFTNAVRRSSGRSRDELRDQLPRIDLGAARLAGYQVDQVQADMHQMWTRDAIPAT